MSTSPLSATSPKKLGPHSNEKITNGDWRAVGGPSPSRSRSNSPHSHSPSHQRSAVQVLSPPLSDPRSATMLTKPNSVHFPHSVHGNTSPSIIAAALKVQSPSSSGKWPLVIDDNADSSAANHFHASISRNKPQNPTTNMPTWPSSTGDTGLEEFQHSILSLSSSSATNSGNERQFPPKVSSARSQTIRDFDFDAINGSNSKNAGGSGNTNTANSALFSRQAPTGNLPQASLANNNHKSNINTTARVSHVFPPSNSSSSAAKVLNLTRALGAPFGPPSPEEEHSKIPTMRARSKSISHETSSQQLNSGSLFSSGNSLEREAVKNIDEVAVRNIWRRGSASANPSAPSLPQVVMNLGEGLIPHRRASTFSTPTPAMWNNGLGAQLGIMNVHVPSRPPGNLYSSLASPPPPVGGNQQQLHYARQLSQGNQQQNQNQNQQQHHQRQHQQIHQPLTQNVTTTRPSQVTASQQTNLSPVMSTSNEAQYGMNNRNYDPAMQYDQKITDVASQNQHQQNLGYYVPRHYPLPSQDNSGITSYANMDMDYTQNLMYRRGTIANTEAYMPASTVEDQENSMTSAPFRRHSMAPPSSIRYHVPGRNLTEAFGSIDLDGSAVHNDDGNTINRHTGQQNPHFNSHQSRIIPAIYGGITSSSGSTRITNGGRAAPLGTASDGGSARPRNDAFSDVGRGVPLHALPSTTPLFIVEFKAGRSDIYYVAEATGLDIKPGSLVIIEGDRGKDLGKVTSEISIHQVHMMQAQRSDALNDIHRFNREIHPKRIFRYANPDEIMHLVTKSQDESKALAVCQTKVRQKKLEMSIVDAEYQWDRRKLTFYFVATRRVDFRELVNDLFKIYKTRIWMNAVPERLMISPLLGNIRTENDGITSANNAQLIKQGDNPSAGEQQGSENDPRKIE